MNLRYIILVLFSVIFLHCQKEESDIIIDLDYIPEIPSHFPEIPFPNDNLYSNERWELGKKLFYSKALSIDSSLSCGSCHNPNIAFANNDVVSLGVEDRIGTRNVPTLTNTAYHPYYTRDAGVPTLEMQALVPIQEHNEFDFNIVLITERLSVDQEIVKMSQIAYDRNLDPFVITRSLSTFQRSMISANSKYDKYLKDEIKLTTEEENGKQLFFSDRLACSTCHGGFDFTDYSTTNNGLYNEYTDPGRFRVTSDSVDLATFKTPSLRNIELTAPYMHDGSIDRLEDVIDHYSGNVKPHLNLDSRIVDFNLSTKEKNDLIAFLHTLTDHEFVENTNFKN